MKFHYGQIKPSIETAKKIADTVGVSVDYLIGDSNKMVLDKKMLERLEQIDNLTKEDKKKVIYIIDNVIREAKTRQAHSV